MHKVMSLHSFLTKHHTKSSKLLAHLPKLLLLAELSNNTQAILGPQATLRLVKKVATKRIMTLWLEACFLVNITL